MSVLKIYLAQHMITQRALAEQIGVNEPNMSRMVNNRGRYFTRSSNLLVIRGLAKMLDCTPGQVLDELIEMENQQKKV